MPISIRLFWNFFRNPSNGFGLFVSSLHEAGSLLLFFLAPSCFLLSFLKGFTCHKTTFSVMDAPRSTANMLSTMHHEKRLVKFWSVRKTWRNRHMKGLT